MELNRGLIQAQNQLKEAYEKSQLRNRTRHEELQEKLKEDKKVSDEYFRSWYSKQDARVLHMQKLLKVDWSDKYGK